MLGKATEGLNFGHAELLNLLANTRERLNSCADFEAACFDTTRQNAANEGVCAQSCGQHAEVFVLVRDLLGSGHVIDDQVKQSRKVFARAVKLVIGPARTARRVHMREVELIVICIKGCEEIKALVQRAVRLGVCFVDFVQDNDRAQAEGEGL